MIQIVTFKWDNGVHPKKGIKFTGEHVNRLRNMVARNLDLEHEFVCITDDPEGIDPNIRIIPLWDNYRDLGGCYVRLKAFSEDMKNIIGERFAWIDLDTIVLGNITHLFDREDDFVIWGDTNPTTPYNGSMVLMNAGCRSQVWTDFDPQTSPKRSRGKGYVGTDQAWIACSLGPDEKMWTIQDGVYSFRCHLEKKHIYEPPDKAKLIFFHGATDPSQPRTQYRYPWITEHWK